MRKIKTKEQKIGFRNMHLKKNLESQQKGEKKKKVKRKGRSLI